MKVLAFGEVMMRLMPRDNRTLDQVDSLDYLYTGTGVNVLGGLSKLGIETELLTCLPDNRVGKSAAAHLRKLGISDQYIQFGGDHMGLYFLEKGFGKRSSHVSYLNRSHSSFALHNYNDINYDHLLDGVDMIHICGISLIQDNTYNLALKLLSEAKSRDIDTVFDCNYRPSLWVNPQASKERYIAILKQCKWVFAAKRDALRLLEGADHLDEQELMIAFKNQFAIEGIFHTIRKGNSIQSRSYRDSIVESRLYDLEVLDRVGGGDGFALGVIFGLLNSYEDSDLLEFATASGVLAHTSYGDTPLAELEEIEDLINGNYVDIKR